MWVESEAGRGSTFHFTAHFAPVKAIATMEAVPDAVGLRGVPVLVVDDNATQRRVLERILIGWSMVPTLAASVPDALAALRLAQESGRAFPLVLTDFQMPGADGSVLAEIIQKDPVMASPAVVMLASVGQLGDAARYRELGIAACLPKPIRPPELRGAILLALGVQAATQDQRVLGTRPSLREPRVPGRILVVEDNRVNQLVAKRLLERGGHTVVVANNGLDALAILDEAASAGFGCVLMDLEMPKMGGLECTSVIRDREQTTGSHLPIIAMTAQAMEGSAARCLAAGMDAYLSKPLEPNHFLDVVERHLRISSNPSSSLEVPLAMG
jgi:CheY-like chemotaxis protein